MVQYCLGGLTQPAWFTYPAGPRASGIAWAWAFRPPDEETCHVRAARCAGVFDTSRGPEGTLAPAHVSAARGLCDRAASIGFAADRASCRSPLTAVPGRAGL